VTAVAGDNEAEMTTKRTYLSDETSVHVGVFGAPADEVTYRVEVTFPDDPLHPVTETRTVRVD
jgi:hypothetical protein